MPIRDTVRVIGLDPAGDGSDLFVGYLWEESKTRGSKITCILENDSTRHSILAKEIADDYRKRGCQGIGIDDVGLGYDFKELLYVNDIKDEELFPFQHNALPEGPDCDEYENLAMEAADDLRKRIERGVFNKRGLTDNPADRILIPNEPALIEQLQQREFDLTRRDKLKLQEKKELDESPDHFEALMIAYWTLKQVMMPLRR